VTASRSQRSLSLERLVGSDRLVAAVGLTLATALACLAVIAMRAARGLVPRTFVMLENDGQRAGRVGHAGYLYHGA
jgi:hypothetical protein